MKQRHILFLVMVFALTAQPMLYAADQTPKDTYLADLKKDRDARAKDLENLGKKYEQTTKQLRTMSDQSFAMRGSLEQLDLLIKRLEAPSKEKLEAAGVVKPEEKKDAKK